MAAAAGTWPAMVGSSTAAASTASAVNDLLAMENADFTPHSSLRLPPTGSPAGRSAARHASVGDRTGGDGPSRVGASVAGRARRRRAEPNIRGSLAGVVAGERARPEGRRHTYEEQDLEYVHVSFAGTGPWSRVAPDHPEGGAMPRTVGDRCGEVVEVSRRRTVRSSSTCGDTPETKREARTDVDPAPADRTVTPPGAPQRPPT